MKVEINPRLAPRRGGEVKIGNVYSNERYRYYRIVMNVLEEKNSPRRARWNNVISLHVDATGEIVGASCLPYNYMKEHQDLIGVVKKMPEMKIDWLKEGDRN